MATLPSDEEAAVHSAATHHFGRYRDDSDDDEGASPDAPLRPSIEFDGLTSSQPSWWAAITARSPPNLQRAWVAVARWVQGPQPSRPFRITPLAPQLQHAPLALLDKFAPKRVQRFWLLILFYACWLLTFSLMLWKSSAAAEIPGYGSPLRLSCEARYWKDGNDCGLNGDQCRPFSNSTLAFRCPADCHKVLMLNPHAVGDQEVVYKPLVVGGPSDQQTGFNEILVDNAIYRGDSFICASAVHSGFIKDNEGGCGVLKLVGEQSNFPASKRHGIDSTGFDSYFPQSFGFIAGSRAECKDLRWPALVPSVFFTAALSLFTTNSGVHFWSIFVGLFFHVALVSDPPDLANFYELLSLAIARFLPACFCAWVTYRYTVKRSLDGLTAQVEKTILWLGPAWVGSLNNYTFDRIPIQRLTPHDIQAQPGAIPALISIVLIIICIALGQAWAFRIEGRMPRYLVIYGLMSATLIIMLIIPGLNLRIHHYILGLLFLPGTSFQNRPSLIYQGLLLGLFINGVARWGFASILETPAALLRDAQQESLLPAITILAIGLKTIKFSFGPFPVYDPKLKISYDGVSVLVNDVERYRGYVDDSYSWETTSGHTNNLTWTWTKHQWGSGESSSDHYPQEVSSLDEQESGTTGDAMAEYFRFAYMAGNSAADFTKAGKWESGIWLDMPPGPSFR